MKTYFRFFFLIVIAATGFGTLTAHPKPPQKQHNLTIFDVSKERASGIPSDTGMHKLQLLFGGDGYFPVELDGYGTPVNSHWPVLPELPYLSPEVPEYYLKAGAPVAYLRGSYPAAKITATVSSQLDGVGVVTGKSTELTFRGKVHIKDGQLQGVVKSEAPLGSSIDLIEKQNITWILQAGADTFSLGTSCNSIYTVLQKPLKALLHTPLHLATIAGKGLTDTLEITDRVWSLVRNQQISRVRDGKKLTYYGLYRDEAPAELRGMLMSGSGQCVAWSHLLYSILASQGIHSDIIMIAPPGKGRLYINNWQFNKGDLFISTGKNGISESKRAGDDIQYIAFGNGQPYSKVWIAEAIAADSANGDDTPDYRVGRNGIVDTYIDRGKASPIIPYGFGLPNQRAYVLKKTDEHPEPHIEGDDFIARQLATHFVFTGSNGIVETPFQDRFLAGKDGKPHPFVSWVPTVGTGASHIKFRYAIPLAKHVPDAGGDDIRGDWWINTGKNGISETAGTNVGLGKGYSMGIAAGPDNYVESKVGGDDSLIDLRPLMKNAPKGYDYIYPFNIWPVPGNDGQHNPFPPTDYPNHLIVRVGDKYYDPSYGTGPFKDPLAWENASLAAVGVQIRDSENNFVRFHNQILFYVRAVDNKTRLTQFIVGLPPL